MWVEGDDHRSLLVGMRMRGKLTQQGVVPSVHAIKDTNGDDGGASGGKGR
jgi:hypothetical protein